MNIDGLSLSVLIAELDQSLNGGRIEKIFQPDHYSLIFKIRMPGLNYTLIVSANPQRPGVYITTKKFENPQTPPAFCMLLRKHLSDARIDKIKQYGLDRIILIEFAIREEDGQIGQKTLIIETMGKHSNIILTSSNNIIIDAIRRIGPAISRHRQVLPGSYYCLPPGQERLNVLTISVEKFINCLQLQTGRLDKAILTTATGLGPITIKEILYRSKLLSTVNIEQLDNAGWCALANNIHDLLPSVVPNQAYVYLTADNKLAAISAFHLEHLNLTATNFATMSQAIEFITTLIPHSAPAKERLQKIVQQELNRLNRKHQLLNQELELANNAHELRQSADILLTFLSQLQPGQASVELPNIYAEDGSLIQITLDPKIPPHANIQAYYNRYNKQKRASQNLGLQLSQLEIERQYLETVQLALEQAQSNIQIQEIEHELNAEGYYRLPSRKKKLPVSEPLSLVIDHNTRLLIGRNNRQNDLVTFKLARPTDFWFHVKDIPGSHVVLRSTELPDNTVLLTAAKVAAYYSKARHSSTVPVDYTLKKYVKKPHGAKPGFVIYDKQTTVYVTPHEQEIIALKAENSSNESN